MNSSPDDPKTILKKSSGSPFDHRNVTPDSEKSYTSSPRPTRAASGYFHQTGQRPLTVRIPTSSSSALLPEDRRPLLRTHSSGLSSGGSSIASSSYLTPPEFGPPDTDGPPYKSLRRDSASLTMLRKWKTTPPEIEPQKSGWQNNKNAFRSLEGESSKGPQERRSSASLMRQDIYDGRKEYNGSGKSRKQSRSKQEVQRGLYSRPAPPVETRRWSSVEIGALPIPQSPILANSVYSTSKRASISSDPTKGNLADVIRKRLSARKVPSIHMETPATITLRKASGTSSAASPKITSPPEAVSPKDLISKIWRSNDQRKPSAYLVTSNEIDAIVRLVEENISKPEPHQFLLPDTFELPAQPAAHRPSVCKGFISIPKRAPADVAVTLSDVHAENPSTIAAFPSLRRVSSAVSISKIYSARSVHEVVWDGHTLKPTLRSVMSTSSGEGFSYERTYSTYDESFPGNQSRNTSWSTKITSAGNRDQFLKSLVSPLVETSFEWSESKPQDAALDTPQTDSQHQSTSPLLQPAAIPIIISQEDNSELSTSQSSSKGPSSRKNSKSKASPRQPTFKKVERTQNPFITAVTSGEDVISFPALPSRQKTSDWISPLPDMSAPVSTPSSIDQGRRKTLYDLGLDITQSPGVLYEDRPLLEQSSSYPSSSTSSSPTENFDVIGGGESPEQHPVNAKLERRVPQKKSISFHHTISDSSKSESSWKREMGKAIGISAGRRKSLGHPLQRAISDSFVKAIAGSKAEADFRRKSLSQHAAGQRIKIMHELEKGKEIDTENWVEDREADTKDELEVPRAGSKNLSKNDVSNDNPPSLSHSHATQSPTSSSSSNRSHKLFPPSKAASQRSLSPIKSPKPPSRASSHKCSRVNTYANRLDFINQKSLPTTQEDCVGIYITMTGTRGTRDDAMRAHCAAQEPANLCSIECESHGFGKTSSADWVE